MGSEQTAPDLGRLSDAELGSRYRAQADSALVELWKRYEGRFHCEACRLAGDRGDLAHRVLEGMRTRLGSPEIRRSYDPTVAWADWVIGQLEDLFADLRSENLPEVDLQRCYRMGERGAFRVLWYVRHYEAIVRSAARFGFHDDDLQVRILDRAEDKLMSAKTWVTYEPDRPWLRWALRILRNEAYNERRKMIRDLLKMAVPIDEGSLADEADQDIAERPTDPAKFRKYLPDCLGRLPELERQAICLHFLHGMKRQDAARAVGRSPAWATTHITTALRKLRACLEQKDLENEQ